MFPPLPSGSGYWKDRREERRSGFLAAGSDAENLARTFDLLSPRPKLRRLLLLFLELPLFGIERFKNGAQLIVGLFELALLEQASARRPPRLPGIAPTE